VAKASEKVITCLTPTNKNHHDTDALSTKFTISIAVELVVLVNDSGIGGRQVFPSPEVPHGAAK
jgi:hypothetical protein